VDKEVVIRKVKAKINLKKKIKDIKKKFIKTKYKTLNEENAVEFAKDLGDTHYWKFDVEDDAKTTKRTYQGVPVIDVTVNSNDNIDKTISVWYDPIEKDLVGDYKSHYESHASYTPEFQFKPLTEENALAYVKHVSKDGFKVDEKSKPKKIKEDGIPMISVPIVTDTKHAYEFLVWYDPGRMGLYGEY